MSIELILSVVGLSVGANLLLIGIRNKNKKSIIYSSILTLASVLVFSLYY